MERLGHVLGSGGRSCGQCGGVGGAERELDNAWARLYRAQAKRTGL